MSRQTQREVLHTSIEVTQKVIEETQEELKKQRAVRQLRKEYESSHNFWHWCDLISFQLQVIGVVIGKSNFFLFPMLAFRHGTVYYLLVYIIMKMLIAFPLLYFELMVGHLTQSGYTRMFRSYGQAYTGIGYAYVILIWFQISSDSNAFDLYMREMVDVLEDVQTVMDCGPGDEFCNSFYENTQCYSGNFYHMGSCVSNRTNTKKLTDAVLEYNIKTTRQTIFASNEYLMTVLLWLVVCVLGLTGVRKLQYGLATLCLVYLTIVFGVCSQVLSQGGLSYGLSYLFIRRRASSVVSGQFWTDLSRGFMYSMGIGLVGYASVASFRPKHRSVYSVALLSTAADLCGCFLGLLCTCALFGQVDQNIQSKYLHNFWKPNQVVAIWTQMLCTQGEDCQFWLLLFSLFKILPAISASFGLIFIALGIWRDHYKKKSWKVQFSLICAVYLSGLIITPLLFLPHIGEVMLVLMNSHFSTINLCFVVTAALIVVTHIYGETELKVDISEVAGMQKRSAAQSPFLFSMWKFICPVVLISLMAVQIASEIQHLRAYPWSVIIIVGLIGTLPISVTLITFFWVLWDFHRKKKPIWIPCFPSKYHPAYKRIMLFYLEEWVQNEELKCLNDMELQKMQNVSAYETAEIRDKTEEEADAVPLTATTRTTSTSTQEPMGGNKTKGFFANKSFQSMFHGGRKMKSAGPPRFGQDTNQKNHLATISGSNDNLFNKGAASNSKLKRTQPLLTNGVVDVKQPGVINSGQMKPFGGPHPTGQLKPFGGTLPKGPFGGTLPTIQPIPVGGPSAGSFGGPSPMGQLKPLSAARGPFGGPAPTVQPIPLEVPSTNGVVGAAFPTGQQKPFGGLVPAGQPKPFGANFRAPGSNGRPFP